MSKSDLPLRREDVGESNDEKVNGAAIAAAIMRRLPAETRVRVLAAMEESSPTLREAVEANLYHFEDITELTSQSIQTIVREAPHDDLVHSLRGAPKPIQQALLRNMSGRKLQMVQEDMTRLSGTKEVEIKEAQRRIMRLIDELQSEGKIRGAVDNEGQYA